MNPINPPFGDPASPVQVGGVCAEPPFVADLRSLLNQHNQECPSNTPDWVLAQYLESCLAAWNIATQQRETWYGRDARPSLPPQDVPSGASNAPDWTSLSRDDLVMMASRLQAECDQLRAQRDCYLASREAYCSERDSLRATVSRLRDALSSTTPYLKRLAVEHNPFAADTLAAVQDALDATNTPAPERSNPPAP